ncbi:MAG: hypothetical protein WCG75_07470 [Armatimonadota bacterium]
MNVTRFFGFGILILSGFSVASDRASVKYHPTRSTLSQGTTLPISGTPPITATISDSPTTVQSSFTIIAQTSWLRNGASVVVSAKQIEDPALGGHYKVTITPSRMTSFNFVENPDHTVHPDESSVPVMFSFKEIQTPTAAIKNVRIEISLAITPVGGGTVEKKFNIDFQMQFHELSRLSNDGFPVEALPGPLSVPNKPSNHRRHLYMDDYYDWFVGDVDFHHHHKQD